MVAWCWTELAAQVLCTKGVDNTGIVVRDTRLISTLLCPDGGGLK